MSADSFLKAAKAFQDLTKAMNESMSAVEEWYKTYNRLYNTGGQLLARHRRRRHK